MRRLPQIDDTRRPMRRAAFHKQTHQAYLSEKHAQVADINPEEIEARYRRRLAELRWQRLQRTTENNAVSEG
jgi:hypothetical protein